MVSLLRMNSLKDRPIALTPGSTAGLAEDSNCKLLQLRTFATKCLPPMCYKAKTNLIQQLRLWIWLLIEVFKIKKFTQLNLIKQKNCLLGWPTFLAILATFMLKVPMALVKAQICWCISNCSFSFGTMCARHSYKPSFTAPVWSFPSWALEWYLGFRKYLVACIGRRSWLFHLLTMIS